MVERGILVLDMLPSITSMEDNSRNLRASASRTANPCPSTPINTNASSA